MRSSRFVLVSTTLTALALGACGSMVNGSSQTVNVVVKGSPSAHCDFYTSKFRNSGSFPNSMTLERSHENLTAECWGEQNKYKKFEIPTRATTSGTAGNVATGIVPGLGYDALSGGMWSYPDPIVVDFRRDPRDENPNPTWPVDTIDMEQAQQAPVVTTTTEITAPKPVHMQPIVEGDLNPALPATHAPLAKTEVIDAVTLATQKKATAPAAVEKVETVTTTPAPVDGPATAAPAKITQMKPIISPEDDPGYLKAKEEAKAKAAKAARAKAEAKKKADEAARAKAAAEKAEAEKAAADKAAADKAAADAAAAAAMAPPAPVAPAAPVPAAPDLSASPPSGPAPSGLMAAPAPDPAAAGQSTAPDTGPKEGQSVDQKDYLQGQ